MAFRDIRKSRKWLSVEEFRLILLALFVLAGLLVLNMYLARVLPGGEQFYLRWGGARGFWTGQAEPYGSAIAEQAQQIAYGRRAATNEYPYVLNDPFHIVLLYSPLAWWISDFTIARGLWMLLSEIVLLALVFSFIRSLEWEPPLWLSIGLAVLGLFGYYSLVALRSGTPAVLTLFLCFLILYSLRSFSDELAGALLFLTASHWEVSALFLLFVIVFVIANRRWRVFYGFLMALTVLLVISLLANPSWMLPYIRALLADGYRSSSLTFGSVVSFWFPGLKFSIGLWMIILLGVILFLEWINSTDAPYRHVAWVVSLSLAATPLMGFPIFLSNHVVMLPAFILILMLVWERWKKRRALFTTLLMLIAFLVPFALSMRLNTEYQPALAGLLNILPPVATIVGLYWMRWWAVRSPRIWADQIGGRK